MVQINEQYDAACFTPGPTEKDGIVIHWWGTPVGQTIDSVRQTFVSGARQTSAHYGATDGIADCYVNPDDVAWANGNWAANLSKISIECDPRQSDGDYQTAAEVIAHIRSIYGDLPLSRHRDYFPTECCGTYDLDRLDRLARGIDVPSSSVTPAAPVATAPAVPAATSKSISQLADEVIAGAYGTGDDRRLALGAQYDEVQAEVNRKLTGTSDPKPQPDINALVDAVLAGAYGNGDQRRTALGANYQAVQDEINRRAGVGSAPAPAPVQQGPDINGLADQVLAGAFGSGAQRQAALGGYYDAVQAEVNRRLGASSGPDIGALADAVLRGEYGTGDDRVNALGENYEAVQAEVNRRLS